jgi:hypothetical protein
MKRQEKYQDTSTFHFFNANPKGRITGDCTFRAVSTALNQSWEETVMDMATFSCETGYAINDKKGIERYLASKGWIKFPQPKKSDNTKYTGKEFCRKISSNILYVGKSIIADIGGHHIVCIKETDGLHGTHKVWDIWDSTDKCIGNYWVKA